MQKEHSASMDNVRDTQALSVSRAESGQKLLNFLQRRISASTGDFHRWIRTGQVRVNGARAKAFDRVAEGDMIRVPPFAERLPAGAQQTDVPLPAERKRSRLDIVFEDGAELKADLSAYLQFLYDCNPSSVGGALPDDSFYYEAE